MLIITATPVAARNKKGSIQDVVDKTSINMAKGTTKTMVLLLHFLPFAFATHYQLPGL
jgi:hypothetical protein